MVNTQRRPFTAAFSPGPGRGCRPVAALAIKLASKARNDRCARAGECWLDETSRSRLRPLGSSDPDIVDPGAIFGYLPRRES